MKNKNLFFVFLFFACIVGCQYACYAQDKKEKTPKSADNKNENKVYDLQAAKTDSVIRLDGVLSESSWQRADIAKDFYQCYPSDTAYAKTKTEVKITYDDKNLYIAAVCYDNIKDKNYVITSLRRDFEGVDNDNFAVYLDPFKDGLNGFMFGVTPLGVEREGLIANGDNMQTSWDNKWYSATKIYADYWIAEMAIPLKTLRFKAESQHWKMNFARIDLKRNERATWVPVPIVYPMANLAFTGNVYFEQPFKKPGANIALVPYLTANSFKDNLPNATPASKTDSSSLSTRGVERNLGVVTTSTSYEGNAGIDAKVAVSPSLNLDLTVNPDFSTVEADVQVTNLSRFEIFFPERRQFFIENSDLFSSFGFSRIRPFFSRRIGIGRDRNTGVIVQNPILYGARLSGKINKDWRMGLMNMQTAAVDNRNESLNYTQAGKVYEGTTIPSDNFTVAAVQRQVFARSNVAAMFVNRQRIGENGGNDDYTRVISLDYNLRSKDNKWSGKFFYHRGFKPSNEPDNQAHAGYLGYNVKKWYTFWNYEYVGQNYKINDIGFVQRRGVWRLEPMAGYNFFPKKSKLINRHGPFIYYNSYWNLDGKQLDGQYFLQYSVDFLNTAYLEVSVENLYTHLFEGFDPTNTNGKRLPIGDYRYNGGYIFFTSSNLRRAGFSANLYYGEYFNGYRSNFFAEFRYRFQPYGSFSINIDYNDIQLPEPYKSAKFALIGTRADVSVNRKLFLTGFLQYNQQSENVNLNARLQWRFRPVSDFFVVYTENYFPTNFAPKGRALVLKLTYWLNI